MIDGIIEKETEKAVFFRPVDEDLAAWIPRSIIPYLRRMGGGSKQAKLEIPAWKIKQLGWEGYEE